uniref:Alkaline phosphatase n=1 Tax=Timema shepardi TaxID=629360 RepID=A0A7R9AYC0_TIMSH|nr:unnamed protein product [Timema shepardi]
MLNFRSLSCSWERYLKSSARPASARVTERLSGQTAVEQLNTSSALANYATEAGEMTSRLVMFSCLLIAMSGGVEDKAFWKRQGQARLKYSLQHKNVEKFAKNVILFVGDGMGMSTVTAARIYKGQRQGRTGEETELVYEKFPFVGLSKTYNVDRQVPDSAGTATAMFSGVKTNYGVLGLDARAAPMDCDASQNAWSSVDSLATWGQDSGRHTGLVTTTSVTHATPAAFYSHINHRDWECDTKIPVKHKSCVKDIARQLVENRPGSALRVILAGGQRMMGFTSEGDDNNDGCKRDDGRNLTEDWLKAGGGKRELVTTKQDLLNVDVGSTDYLMGLFSRCHIPYKSVRGEVHPSLVDMTIQAIRVLSKNPTGFILMVEGGRIDHGHHDNFARLALEEAVELEQAIEAAVEMTDPENTLIVVTADHSHSFTFNGYPLRGNDILGFANETDQVTQYETLSYANGPGYYSHRLNGTDSSPNNTWKDAATFTAEERADPYYRSVATFYLDHETHGGEDVPVFARGPFAHLLAGVYEQSYIAHAIGYAACIGPSQKLCAPRRFSSEAGVGALRSLWLLGLMGVVLVSL